MKILIKLFNQHKVLNIIADEESGFFIDGKEIDFDAKYFAKKIITITKDWKEKYYNSHIIDGFGFKIKIVQGNKEKVFVGKNAFPKNYDEFDALIGEVIE